MSGHASLLQGRVMDWIGNRSFIRFAVFIQTQPTLPLGLSRTPLAMASAEGGDKYRSFLHGDGEKNTVWRHGFPPNYDLVNKLFEEERTKEWPEGSLEEKVQ
uniref:Uncharacterized protein n=1 Tax=Aegilops tauschii subsp. strangulata TaxID=200361 RepID=A0A453ELU5_AEGTS